MDAVFRHLTGAGPSSCLGEFEAGFNGARAERLMRVKVDADRCQGHAMCTLACPELFHLNDDDGHAFVVQEVVPVEFEEHVRQAQRGCPEDAIFITEA
jgi:ferredoxin